MTDTEIIQIARKYRKQANFPFEDPTEAKIAAMDVIKFLLSDYAIISKNKLRSVYTRVEQEACNRPTCMDRTYARGKQHILRELFPADI